MKNLFVLLALSTMLCSCAQISTPPSHYQNMSSDLTEKGTSWDVVSADIKDISMDVIEILRDNYSLDDTFFIDGNTNKGLYKELVPKMKQAGFKVITAGDASVEHKMLSYSFSVTNNNLIETPDVALLRIWVNKDFQISKAFIWTSGGLFDKTGYTVIGGGGYE